MTLEIIHNLLKLEKFLIDYITKEEEEKKFYTIHGLIEHRIKLFEKYTNIIISSFSLEDKLKEIIYQIYMKSGE